jgi:dynein intermediate chain 2
MDMPCNLHPFRYPKQEILQVNTLRAEYMSQGMNHFEGGWPKDINPAEHDQTMRFRKKIEKDDSYINSVLGLCQVSLVK